MGTKQECVGLQVALLNASNLPFKGTGVPESLLALKPGKDDDDLAGSGADLGAKLPLPALKRSPVEGTVEVKRIIN